MIKDALVKWLLHIKKVLNSIPNNLLKIYLSLVFRTQLITNFTISKLPLLGAREVECSIPNLNSLKLNSDGYLGKKGDLIYLPKDKVIFNHVAVFGNWEISESQIIAEKLSSFSEKHLKSVVLLDIGANVGLVSLQALNISGVKVDVHLVEPLPNHVLALKQNFEGHSKQKRIFIHEFALSRKSGNLRIFTELQNRGNSSFNKELVVDSSYLEQEVSVVATAKFFEKNLGKYKFIILKSDTQGYDAKILAQVPPKFWKKIELALIEIWANDFIDPEDVGNLIAKFRQFDSLTWESTFNENATLVDIHSFWLSKSGKSRNLILQKSC